MSVSPYAKYKKSGVEGLDVVPAHWSIGKFRHYFTESGEKIDREKVGPMLSVSGYRGIEIKEYDDENRRRLDEDLVGYRIVRIGQLVVNTMWLNYAGLGISSHEGHVSPAYRSYWISDTAHKPYLHYLLRSSIYVQGYTRLLTGIRPNSLQISREDLMAFPILFPPPEEQRAIAAFLDHETAKVDGLVAEQQRLIELLKEKRQAVISDAVTRGLKKGLPVKDSGIEWLGQVPAHWEVRRAKTVSTFVTSGPRGWAERVGEDGPPFIQSGDLNDVLQIDFAAAKRVRVQKDAEASRTRLYDGDVVVCITGAKTGNVAVCPAVPGEAYINQHLCIIRPNQEILPMYLGVALKSRIGQTYFNLSQYGLKQGLSLEDVKNAPVLLPPRVEQSAIVSFLNLRTTQLNTLIAEAETGITLLQERRAALISSAVTGKIDVRGLVAAEPDKEAA